MNVLSRALLAGLVFGAAAIAALRLVLSGLVGAVVTAIVAVAVIAIVGLYYHQKVSTQERQVAGDNLYYLGLLFTLLSMILALFQLFALEAGQEFDERAYELIRNFAVALVSTVAGILGRILLHSAIGDADPETGTHTLPEVMALSRSSTPDSGELTVHGEYSALRDELATLRRVLREATDAFSHFNRVTADRSAEAMAHTDSVMREFNEGMVSAVAGQLEQATATLQAATETLRSQSATLTNHFENVVSEFNSALTSTAYRGLDDTREAWRTAAGDIQTDGQRHLERFREDTQKLVAAADGAWKELMVLSERIVAAGQDLNAQTTAFRGMMRDTTNVSQSIKSFIEHLANAQRQLATTADAAANAARRVDDNASDIKRLGGSIDVDIGRIGKAAVRSFEAAAAELSAATGEQLAAHGKEWLDEASASKDALERHKHAAAENLAAAQRINERIAQEASQWGKLAEQTRHSLVDAIDKLTERVNKG